jgi:hypothetical protein
MANIVNNYYIIYANDPTYPQGCNTIGLQDEYNNCILAIPNGTGYVYVSPAATKIVTGYNDAQTYCTNLDLGNVTRKTPRRDWY